jgi:glycosyltransferase involved in cell wall biosynthesis
MKNFSKPKIALYYDWLNQWGGAEKVLLNLISLYPDAPVYTLVYNPKKTPWLPPTTKVIPSFINRLPFSKNNPIFYTPFYDLALEQFKFSKYDIVISTTTTVGHCLLTPPQTMFLCYYENTNRYLYQIPFRFRFLKPLLNIYKKFDYIYSRRPDHPICISQTVQKRISDHFHLKSQIIYPGVDTDFFVPASPSTSDYFLIVSRLVAHKNIDLVINTFNHLSAKLIIIGRGRESVHLKKLAANNPNIRFLGQVSNDQIRHYYQNCLALICPQLEDFGLTPLEAQACGKPVIALGIGGNTETIINGKTGIFFNHPTVSSLTSAINIFNHTKFIQNDCRQNSVKFSVNAFMLNFKQAVDHLWQQHQTTTF